MAPTNKRKPETFDVGYEGHQRRQVRLGLELTPAQRLEWLERKLGEMQRNLGTARRDSEPQSENSPMGTAAKPKP